MLPGKSREIAPKRMKRLGQSGNDGVVWWMCLVVKMNSDAVRNSGCFAEAVVKRYPTPKVRETQVRWYVLQEGIRGQTH